MKVTLEFDGHEERQELMEVLNVHKYTIAMGEFERWLRMRKKHGPNAESGADEAQLIWEQWCECLASCGVEL